MTNLTPENTWGKAQEAWKLMSDIVGSTMGPSGRTVLIDYGRSPHFTKDGMTVSLALQTPDPVLNSFIVMGRSAAIKTEREVGDGTTSTIVTVGTFMANSPTPPSKRFIKGMDAGLDYMVGKLGTITETISRDDVRLKDVIRISSDGDEELTEAVAQCYLEVSDISNVLVDRMNGPTHHHTSTGVVLDTTVADHSLIPASLLGELTLKNPVVLLMRGRVGFKIMGEFLGIIQGINESPEFKHRQQPFVIIADEFEPPFIQTIAKLISTEGMQISLIKAPSQGGKRLDMMEDLAVILGTKVYDPHNVQQITKEELRMAVQVGIGPEKVVVKPQEGFNTTNEYLTHIEMLEKVNMEHIKEERLAFMAAKTVKLFVGGESDIEIGERMGRAEDAVKAARTALKSGVVYGGGTALFHLAADTELINSIEDGEFKRGFDFFMEHCTAPFHRVLENAGVKIGKDSLVELWDLGYGWGFKVGTDEHVFYNDEGIYDPAGVIVQTLINATSIFKTLAGVGHSIIEE